MSGYGARSNKLNERIWKPDINTGNRALFSSIVPGTNQYKAMRITFLDQ